MDKIMNSDTRVKVVRTGLTQNMERWTNTEYRALDSPNNYIRNLHNKKDCQKSKLYYTPVTPSAVIHDTVLCRYNMISKCIRTFGVISY
jgi:hypothetical protein